MTGRRPAGNAVVWLVAATLLCYGVGYPLALLGHSPAGWVLVFLGGPLLIALGIVTVRRIHRAGRAPAPPAEPDGTRPPV